MQKLAGIIKKLDVIRYLWNWKTKVWMTWISSKMKRIIQILINYEVFQVFQHVYSCYFFAKSKNV